MKTNVVRAKLKRGEPSIGTWLTLASPFAAKLMSHTGFDWLTVEMEHAPGNLETAATCFAIISGAGPVPLARVPWNTGENIKRVLDNGAWGVVSPMIKTREDAQLLVNAARYAPIGDRSIGGQLPAASFGTDQATYYKRANDELLVVVMIEHVMALENLDAILSVPGIDVAFIGPNDLTNSMGKAPVFESPDADFVAALDKVLATSKKYGVAPGIHVQDADAARRRIAQGFQFIALSSEAGLMLARARESLNYLGLGKGHVVAKY